MFKNFKNRVIKVSEPVRVHRNLHIGGYSIKQGGVVVAHANDIILHDCKFIVSEAGRQRVRATRQKNVHAFVEGKLAVGTFDASNSVKVTYNPFVNEGFVDENNNLLSKATVIYLTQTGVWANETE